MALAAAGLLTLPGSGHALIGTGQPIDDGTLAPHVITGDATDVTRTSATLNAQIDPNFQATTVRFTWGAAGSPLTNVLTVPGTIGSPGDAPGTNLRPVAAQLTGLTAGTTYTVAAEATNASGTMTGLQTTLTTLAPPDRIKPIVSLKIVPRPKAKLLSSGIRVRVTMNEPGGVSSVVRDGRGVQLSRNVTGTGFVREAGAVSIFIKLTARANQRIRSNPRIRWTVAVTAVDTAGNQTVATIPFRLG